MDIRRGIAVSPGVAVGPALVLDTEGVRIHRQVVDAGKVDAEIGRFRDAVDRAAGDARARQKSLTQSLGKEFGDIFLGHALLFEDQLLRAEVEQRIRSQAVNAEYALSRTIRDLVKRLDQSGAGERAARFKADFIDLEKQILGHLIGLEANTLDDEADPLIVLAHDLTPSETALLPTSVLAFATESGGPTSHTAILANAKMIPAVVALGRFAADVSGSDTVIVDGNKGLLILDPDEPTLAWYESQKLAQKALADPLVAFRDMPPITKDGVRITLLGNIEFPSEAALCLDRGAEGVGLYRTEFLYLNKTADPTEEEHYRAYSAVLEATGPNRPVVIRTLDLGADKFSSLSEVISVEKNPFLGLRSVRLCLKNKKLFKTQLRAILRASVDGDVRVMFPMVSTILELRQCRSFLNEVREDLEEEGIPFKADLPIGTMIEVPSAAILADLMAREVDFFSIGTNDLVQYTLAADRNNENVASLYNPADPAVLRLIKTVVDAAARRSVSVNVCGEMSGDPTFTALLVGLGLRQLSATPRKIPELKRVIRLISVADAERVAREALTLETARDVTTLLKDNLRRILPDAVV
ncbi:MAG TPA: phosphoenolpyruvate--protein phosphotransferase [Fimbriiglobus sp.]|jgi:phosphotransferase system enzyme I (PtsI)